MSTRSEISISEIFEHAQTLMGTAPEVPMEPGYRFFHGMRVASIAVELNEKLNLHEDERVLKIGGLLHDVAKSVDPEDNANHGPAGAEIVAREFARFVDADALARVCDIVRNHYRRPKSKWFAGAEKPTFSNDVLLIQDADILDHFGTEGIRVKLYWAKHRGLSPKETAEFWFTSDFATQTRTEARASLNFAESVAMFDARIDIMNAFFSDVAASNKTD